MNHRNLYIYYPDPKIEAINNIHYQQEQGQEQEQGQDIYNQPDIHEQPDIHKMNQMYVYNGTNETDFYDEESSFLFNFMCNFLLVICFFELIRRCYIGYQSNQIEGSQRLLDNSYNFNKIIIKENFNNDNCSICLDDLYSEDDLESNNDIIELKCKHMFHKKCLDPWVNEHKKCPLCKCEIK